MVRCVCGWYLLVFRGEIFLEGGEGGVEGRGLRLCYWESRGGGGGLGIEV